MNSLHPEPGVEALTAEEARQAVLDAGHYDASAETSGYCSCGEEVPCLTARLLASLHRKRTE